MSEWDHLCKVWRGIYSFIHSFIHQVGMKWQALWQTMGNLKLETQTLPVKGFWWGESYKPSVVWNGLNVTRTSWATQLDIGNLFQLPTHSAPKALREQAKEGHAPLVTNKTCNHPLCKASLLLSHTACHLIPPQRQALSFFFPPHDAPPLATWLI